METFRVSSLRRFPLVPTALAVLLGAAGSAPALGAVPAATFAPTSRLEQALDTVNADEIRSDLFFIASDELGGRDTPSEGQRIAARFIRARLERLGWKPGARDGYFFEYPDRRTKLDEEGSEIAWSHGETKGDLRFGDDYFLLSTSECRDLEASGEVVFCGKAGAADFESLGVQGRWALCFDDGSEPRGLRGPARQAGAVGVLLGPGPDYSGEPYEKRFEREVERVRRGFGAFRGRRGEDSEESDDPYPLVLLSARATGAIVEAAGVPPGGPAPGTLLGLSVHETRHVAEPARLENVCGFWPGSDPELAKETIVISAHYDHVGTRRGEVYNGADDNGSGTCGLMAVAEALARYGPMRRSVFLMWVSGEEKGLWGSEAWTKDPWLPGDAKPICDINIDMIGRNEPDKLLITPTKDRPEYNGLVRIAERVAPIEGFPALGSCDDYWDRSDHMNFARNLGIPVAFLFSDVHEDYHKPTDDPEKVDTDKVRRVSRMVLRMLEELQADGLEL